MKRKLLLLLATLAIVANAWCLARTTFISNGITFNITSTNPATVEVISNNQVYSGDISIPTTVEYGETSYAVTAIVNAAFYNCSSLTSITIPSSVTAIGNEAFWGCSGLTSITIPSSPTREW